MEHNREVKELPDRWILRLAKAVRPHGRIAVISSCATAGLLLIVGGVVFANSGDRTVTNLSSSPKTSVSPSPDGTRVTPKGQDPTESTTSTTVSSNTSVAHPLPSTETGLTNPAPAASPTTAAPGASTTTTIAPTPSTGTPPTTASSGGPIATSSLSVNADWATQTTPDDPIVNLRVSANDSSGYIASITVIWSDGTQTVLNNPNACVLPLKSSFSATVTHSYSAAGTYTVAATATSTDCGGATQQQLSRLAKSVTVGGSSPTTAPPTTSTTTGP